MACSAAARDDRSTARGGVESEPPEGDAGGAHGGVWVDNVRVDNVRSRAGRGLPVGKVPAVEVYRSPVTSVTEVCACSAQEWGCVCIRHP